MYDDSFDQFGDDDDDNDDDGGGGGDEDDDPPKNRRPSRHSLASSPLLPRCPWRQKSLWRPLRRNWQLRVALRCKQRCHPDGLGGPPLPLTENQSNPLRQTSQSAHPGLMNQ